MPEPLAKADFRALELTDKPAIRGLLAADQPQISELTFTNLFMWRRCFQTAWTVAHDCLVVVLTPPGAPPFALPPHGPGDKAAALDFAAEALGPLNPGPAVQRVDRDWLDRYVDPGHWRAELDRDQSDYVYLSTDLINLSGQKFHGKKNHLNKFRKNYQFEYRALDQDLIDRVLAMQTDWCELRQCADDPSLIDEDQAIHEALTHWGELDYIGGAIIVDDQVAAFSLGERLNPETAVIHIEKADPNLDGLYAAINQQFCAHAWAEATYINREQDLGLEGLRRAKQSYRPVRMVDKYRLTPSPDYS